MLYATLKVLITSILVVAVSEAAKRSSLFGALLASLPLVSVLAFIWLYVETGDIEKIASLAQGIFWLVLPSLVLFLALPFLLRHGVGFYLSLFLSIGLTAGAYLLMTFALGRFGSRLNRHAFLLPAPVRILLPVADCVTGAARCLPLRPRPRQRIGVAAVENKHHPG